MLEKIFRNFIPLRQPQNNLLLTTPVSTLLVTISEISYFWSLQHSRWWHWLQSLSAHDIVLPLGLQIQCAQSVCHNRFPYCKYSSEGGNLSALNISGWPSRATPCAAWHFFPPIYALAATNTNIDIGSEETHNPESLISLILLVYVFQETGGMRWGPPGCILFSFTTSSPQPRDAKH